MVEVVMVPLAQVGVVDQSNDPAIDWLVMLMAVVVQSNH
jgi:hypothetical protein